MKCPFCDAEAEVPTVDIGVGNQQCGPATCPECHAYQDENGYWQHDTFLQPPWAGVKRPEGST